METSAAATTPTEINGKRMKTHERKNEGTKKPKRRRTISRKEESGEKKKKINE